MIDEGLGGGGEVCVLELVSFSDFRMFLAFKIRFDFCDLDRVARALSDQD